MKVFRKNNKNSYYQLQLVDTEDLKQGLYLYTEVKNGVYTSKCISTVIYIKTKIESKNYLTEQTKNIYEVIVHNGSQENSFIVEAQQLFDSAFGENEHYKEFFNNGLINWESKKYIVEFLKLQQEDKYVNIVKGVENLGWSDGHYYCSGFSTDTEKVFTGSKKNGFKQAGSAEEQYKLLKTTLTDFPLAFFVMSYAIAGFFNRFLGEDNNQILELLGETSLGKSTLGKLCMSIFTSPSKAKSFNTTKNAMLESLKYSNDGFSFLDEIGELTLKDDERLDLVYKFSNAQTKQRLTKFGSDKDFKPSDQDRLYYSLLLGGEKSILANVKKTGGVEARLCQIVLDKNTTLFENVTPEYIESFNQSVAENYGHIGPDLINLIYNLKHTLKEEYTKNLEFVRSKYKINSVLEARKIKILAYVYTSAVLLCTILFEEEEDSTTLIENMLNVGYNAIFSNISYSTVEEDVFKTSLSSVHLTHTQYFKIFEGLSETSTYNLKDYWGNIYKSIDHIEMQVLSIKIEDFCSSLSLDKDRLLSYVKEHGFAVCDNEKGRARKTKKIKGVNYYVFKIPLDFFEYQQEVIEQVTPPITQEDIDENPFTQDEDDDIIVKPAITLV